VSRAEPHTVPPPETRTESRADASAGSRSESRADPRVPAEAQTTGRQAPLKDPLPKVDSILIDQERRLAIVEGTIVTVGDIVGLRVVTQIDRDGVVFREPSGLIVRVALRFSTTGG
jgi:hypothetical protein